MKCKICEIDNKSIFTSRILNKYDIQYFYCSQCGFLQTEEPYWLDEAYNNPINISDTGYMQRNLTQVQKVTVLIGMFFNKHSMFLDYAGGYGVFVRLMRDIGLDFYWNDKYSANLFARGFEYNEQVIEAITTFESFEHYVNPCEEIEKLLVFSKTIIFSTELLSDTILLPDEWWYYGLDHGQHISFYSERTFKFIANKYGLKYYNLGSLQVLTNKELPSYTKYILRFSHWGPFKLIQKKLNSRTQRDYYKMSKKI